MLAGFPKQVTVIKIRRGEYKLVREDGYEQILQKMPSGRWRNSSGTRWADLKSAIYDMRCGYTSYDQLWGSNQ